MSRNFSNKVKENVKYRKKPLRHIKCTERFNTHVIGVLEGKNRSKAVFEEILANNCPD